MDDHMEQSKVMIGDKCAEIYTYESPDLVYAMNWSVRIPGSGIQHVLFGVRRT